MHIGNYLGALKPWAELQGQGETYYFIPNLHSLNVRPDPVELMQNTLSTAAWLLAVGIDPKKSVIYVQSQIPAHAELCWILQNFVTIGELSRMTQYKDKAAKRGTEGELAALFTYPVLMAADILLYDADVVPVGEDQKQHVELARDIATRFNNLYGDTFKVPQPQLPSVGGRVMSLQDPSSKMSKSDKDQGGNIMLLEDQSSIRKKIQRAVTDSGSAVELSDDKPALANLLQIAAGFRGEPVNTVADKFAGKGYAEFKTALADLVCSELESLQIRYDKAIKDPKYLKDVLEEGRVKASKLANAKLDEVKERIGLL